MKLFLTIFLCYLNFILVKNAKTCTKSGDKNCNQLKSTEKPIDNSIETLSEKEDLPAKDGETDAATEEVSVVVSTVGSTKLPKSPTPKSKKEDGASKGLFKSLAGRAKAGLAYISRKDEEDVNLQAFKGADEDQNEKEQEETDTFFSQFKNVFGKACYKHIGCFSSAEYNDFVTSSKPLVPSSPDEIKPNFHIYTIESRLIPRNFTYNATQSQLRYSTFNPKFRTAFIIHGFQSGLSVWMENLKDFIQYQSGNVFNVVLVSWENGAKASTYGMAAANTRVVGACIGYFIGTLSKTFNITNDMIHLIGHGLGAHAAGYAAKRLFDPKVHRITALDAAGVGFHFHNPSMRLDVKDATIVDVFHTDIPTTYTDGFGMKDPIGHYDFYPNGGAWQPGCSDSSSVVQRLSTLTNGEEISCSHSRAFSLSSNLNKPEDDCMPIAYQCSGYEMFLEGRCVDCRNNKCQLMALNPSYWLTQEKETSNKTSNKKYFVNTSNKEEFCLYHYQFGLHTTNDSDSTTGYLDFILKMKLPDDKNQEIEIQRVMTKTYQAKIHTFLLTFNYKIERIYGIDVKWDRYNATERYRVNRGYKLIIPYIEVNYLSHFDESVRKKHSSILCSDAKKIIVNKEKKEFKECEDNLNLEQKASETEPDKLSALEWKEDIYSVDHLRYHRVHHKIAGTRIRDKVKKSQIVD